MKPITRLLHGVVGNIQKRAVHGGLPGLNDAEEKILINFYTGNSMSSVLEDVEKFKRNGTDHNFAETFLQDMKAVHEAMKKVMPVQDKFIKAAMADEGGYYTKSASTSDDLMKIWKSVSSVRPIAEAKKMFPDQPENYVRVAKDVGNWCSNTATYWIHPDQEKKYKPIADRIYKEMPDYGKKYIDGLKKKFSL